MLYLSGFHSLVLGRVAVFLLVDAGKVDTTRDAFVIKDSTLEMVKIVALDCRDLGTEPS